MAIEWVVFALTVVFALGWLAARLDIRHIRRSAAALPRAYLRGLAALLNGQESQALDAFSEIANTETLPPELQFTVGELSRRRGDYRRALKIHRQLHENEALNNSHRNRALWELACDCDTMGFADAAERLARLLADIPEFEEEVFVFRLKNYQMRRRYDEAISMIENAGQTQKQLHEKTAAQLCCELAQNSSNDAAALLEKALSMNAACARARLLLAERAIAEQQPQQAMEQYALLAAQAPAYLWLAAAPLMQIHAAACAPAQGRAMLLNWLRDFPSPMLFKTVIRLLEEARSESPAEATALGECLRGVIHQFIAAHNSLEAAAYFIETQAAGGDTEQWLAVKNILLSARRKPFVCGGCAYEVNHFIWQCPCCLQWESFRQQAL